MGRIASHILVTALFTFSPAALASDDGGSFRFDTRASGAQEIQPAGGVETDTSARLTLRFERDLSVLDFDLRVFDGELITQAHLHCARAGVNGPVVVFLFNSAPVQGPGGVNVDGRLSDGTLTNADVLPVAFEENPACGVVINNLASLLAAIQDGIIYLNVHSEGNPAGEVRGQVIAGGDDGADEDDD